MIDAVDFVKYPQVPPIRVDRDLGKERIVLGHSPEPAGADMCQDQPAAAIDIFGQQQPPRTSAVNGLER